MFAGIAFFSEHYVVLPEKMSSRCVPITFQFPGGFVLKTRLFVTDAILNIYLAERICVRGIFILPFYQTLYVISSHKRLREE